MTKQEFQEWAKSWPEKAKPNQASREDRARKIEKFDPQAAKLVRKVTEAVDNVTKHLESRAEKR
jgi:hypothetical protein